MHLLRGFLSVVGGVVGGVVVFTGGVFLTVATGGVAAVVVGGVLTGVGATASIQPVAEKMNGERMTGKYYVKDVVAPSEQ